MEKKNCKNRFALSPTLAKCEQDVDLVKAEKEIYRSDYEEERRSKVEGVKT